MSDTLEDVSHRVNISTSHPWGVTARVVSQDESREYRVMVMVDDEDGAWGSCTCMGWRQVGRWHVDGWCKHIQTVFIRWRNAQPD